MNNEKDFVLVYNPMTKRYEKIERKVRDKQCTN